MKVVILAGGFGTRISEESYLKPKPMIEIGGMPILWHIMKNYSSYGYNDFIICAGYKQDIIKKWFNDYFLYTSDVTFDFSKNNSDGFIIHNSDKEDWKVTVVNTGLKTETAGRLKRIQKYIGKEKFHLTYGDAVGNVNISDLVRFHEKNNKKLTMSVYNFGQNKGVVEIKDNNLINDFREKSDFDGDLINIGFMVVEPEIFNYIYSDNDVLEKGPIKQLVSKKEVVAYKHQGFWQCMDTLKEKKMLEKMWENNKALWKIW